jgi:tRNA (mo5U34)-methyltransferase
MTAPAWPADPDRWLPGWPLQEAAQRFGATHHGDYKKWAQALADLPPLDQPDVDYGDTVTISGNVDAAKLQAALQQLHPWRKGPFQIGAVKIDTEWRSDWKWARVAPALGDMHDERVLDIGCGNGYFGWRMLASGAREVIGIDPTLLFCMQHLAIQHYTQDLRNWVLPLKVEELPEGVAFDTVCSMGVVYHRRDPLQHTRQLAALTRQGGRVVLESLIVEGDEDLIPEHRYARMRNVWCVPTLRTMQTWLAEAGFDEICVVDVSPTTTAEQRSTEWMRFESLVDSLNPEDAGQTVEGYPSPVRAVVVGRKTS